MTELHARLDLLEGELPAGLVGAAGLSKRSFAVLRLTRADGTTGVGEASPLPGYSPDSIEAVAQELQRLVERPVVADPLASPFELLSAARVVYPFEHPSSRFALEVALLDWLGHTRQVPLHEILGGEAQRRSIPIADLVQDPDPRSWPARADALIADGATHLKLKIGADLDAELEALAAIRRSHPSVSLRLDGNRRLSIDRLRECAPSLEALQLELLEEPVGAAHWHWALDLPLPFALDETLRDPVLTSGLLETGRIRALVLKPMVLGGLAAAISAAELAASHGAAYLVSHTFDGPIARAATAELALALQTELAAGLGAHPALDLWPPHRIAAIADRQIRAHDTPGLGLWFRGDADE